MSRSTLFLKNIDKMVDKNIALEESVEPLIGIFWVIPGKEDPIVYGTPLSHVSADNDGFKNDDNLSHVSIWNHLKSHYNASDKDYNYYPRGRIYYDIKENMFGILIDKCVIDNNEMIKKILHQFRIRGNNYRLEENPHYNCQVCK